MESIEKLCKSTIRFLSKMHLNCTPLAQNKNVTKNNSQDRRKNVRVLPVTRLGTIPHLLFRSKCKNEQQLLCLFSVQTFYCGLHNRNAMHHVALYLILARLDSARVSPGLENLQVNSRACFCNQSRLDFSLYQASGQLADYEMGR